MKNFALLGASGYIAPRHLKAIKETNNEVIVALDKYDSVGIIDSYFPDANFFTEPERFDRHLEKLKYESKRKLDFFTICTPNYLHDSHIRMALRRNADAICEKPIVLNPWNLDALEKMEKETGNTIYNILQLRVHKTVQKLKKLVSSADPNKIYDIDLTYITSRGKWYFASWKGDERRSGGIATNIGVHFFDMLSWIFGVVKRNDVHIKSHDRAGGYLEFQNARVRWFLSVNYDLVPEHIKKKGQRTFRSIKIDKNELEFSEGFNDLHTILYKEILKGKGFRISDTRQSIEIVHEIRNSSPLGLKGDYHPMSKNKIIKHPFK